MADNQDDSFNASKAEVFEALGHPTRIKLLQTLSETPLSFTELKRAAGLDSNGLLTFHLGKMRDLIRLNAEGSYALTDEGREALRVVEASRKQPEEQRGQKQAFHLPLERAVLAGFLVFIIVLGSVAVYQQAQLGSLNARETTSSLAPNVLVYGTAGVNQSWPSGVQGSFQVTQLTFLSDKGQVYRSYPNSAGQYWVSLPTNQTYTLIVSYHGSGTCAQGCASVDNFSLGIMTVSISGLPATSATGQATTTCAPSGCQGVGVTVTGFVTVQEQGDSITSTGSCSSAPLELVPGDYAVNYNPSC
jgi:DNA-binding transcriptional ArsR family regulator